MLHDNFIKTAKQESHEFKALLNILSSLNLHTKEGRKLLCVLNNIIDYIIRKSKFPQNPKRSVRFSGKGTKRSVQKRKARNTQKAETKVL